MVDGAASEIRALPDHPEAASKPHSTDYCVHQTKLRLAAFDKPLFNTRIVKNTMTIKLPDKVFISLHKSDISKY